MSYLTSIPMETAFVLEPMLSLLGYMLGSPVDWDFRSLTFATGVLKEQLKGIELCTSINE